MRRTSSVGWGVMVLVLATASAFMTRGVRTALAEPADDRTAAENALAQLAAATVTATARDAGAEGSLPGSGGGHAALGPTALGDGGLGDGGTIGQRGIGDAGIAEDAAGDAAPGVDPSIALGPAAQARRALERARGARAAGDMRHAELLEGLAREWAEAARDVLRAAEIEQQANALEMASAAAATRAQRARALLEVDVARRGRAEAELARLSSGSRLPTSADTSAPRPVRPASGSANKGAP